MMKMKGKAFYLFTVLAALSFVSCQKVEKDQSDEESSVMTLGDCTDFEFMMPETKAAKTGWTEGDVIDIWFYKGAVEQSGPDLKLTYHSGSWRSRVINPGCTLRDGGSFTCVYTGNADITSYSHMYDGYYKNYFTFPSARNQYCDNYGASASPMLITIPTPLNYTLDGTRVSATITGWEYYTTVKFVIRNDNGQMAGDPSDYYLKVEYYDTYYPKWVTTKVASGFNIEVQTYDELITSRPTTSGYEHAIGVSDPAGVAFHSFTRWHFRDGLRLTLSGPQIGDTPLTYTVKTPPQESHDQQHCDTYTLAFSKFQ